jgi:hypothetical protein
MLTSGFPATRWTLIVAAGSERNVEADEAVAELCKGYWFPCMHLFEGRVIRRKHPKT